MSERYPVNLQLKCWNWEVFSNLVRHFIRQQPNHCILLARHYPSLRLKKLASRLEIQKSQFIISRHLAYTEEKSYCWTKDIMGATHFADFFRQTRFTTYICNSLINDVLKIAWLQYQTAQPLWPTRLERDYQGP